MVHRGVLPPTLTLPLRGGGDQSEAPLPNPPLRRGGSRNGFTLLELIVGLGIITVLLALLLPAIQRVRGADVHFLTYKANAAVLPALATRAGREGVRLEE